jgi:serine/threonine protein kinase
MGNTLGCLNSSQAAEERVANNESKNDQRAAVDGEVKLEETKAEHKASLADYKTMKKLGTGGYGYVVRVQKEATGEIFAMKVMSRYRKGVDFGPRFWNEAKIVESLHHENIISFDAAFENDENYFLVTECVMEESYSIAS